MRNVLLALLATASVMTATASNAAVIYSYNSLDYDVNFAYKAVNFLNLAVGETFSVDKTTPGFTGNVDGASYTYNTDNTFAIAGLNGGAGGGLASYNFFDLAAITSTGTYASLGGFGDATLTVSQVAGVPEPATWAMMIGGVGMIGGTLRRRRAVSVRVAYA